MLVRVMQSSVVANDDSRKSYPRYPTYQAKLINTCPGKGKWSEVEN